MPSTFVQIGAHYVNLELVTSIELVADTHDPAKIVAARVYFTHGKSQDFKSAGDIQGLADWLRAHKAP
jgi:hypothetical protein